jgi:hypothetical protein
MQLVRQRLLSSGLEKAQRRSQPVCARGVGLHFLQVRYAFCQNGASRLQVNFCAPSNVSLTSEKKIETVDL